MTIQITEEIGKHVLVGHYSNLKSGLATSGGINSARYDGKAADHSGVVWHLFSCGTVKFACRDYTRKCKAYRYMEVAG